MYLITSLESFSLENLREYTRELQFIESKNITRNQHYYLNRNLILILIFYDQNNYSIVTDCKLQIARLLCQFLQ